MKLLFSRKLIGTAILLLVLATSISTEAVGQGRGRRVFGGGGFDKKCGKFVNCHDARDGRWDGRGPRRDRDFRRNRGFRRDRDSGRNHFWRRDRRNHR
jgi:hypothetical protein